jgi:hypothetical protein
LTLVVLFTARRVFPTHFAVFKTRLEIFLDEARTEVDIDLDER